ncbi:Uncharacterized protein Fot_06105 [Forsythia ovata]|uniref:Uncharacterized protein n=1 Tax=Forsythia ovata TaxID=205694 RepID=A0ABD1WSC9_9LAMI
MRERVGDFCWKSLGDFYWKGIWSLAISVGRVGKRLGDFCQKGWEEMKGLKEMRKIFAGRGVLAETKVVQGILVTEEFDCIFEDIHPRTMRGSLIRIPSPVVRGSLILVAGRGEIGEGASQAFLCVM